MNNTINERTPILFAQTREDPMVEINIIEKLGKNNKNHLDICLIASAGDTLCSLISYEPKLKINTIDVIDSNINQLNLAILKMALVQEYEGNTNLKILSGNYGENINDSNISYQKILENLLKKKLINNQIYNYWLDNFDLFVNGVIGMGRFEMLFKKVMEKEDFGLHFSHENLTKIFGEAATQYSMNKPFSLHFINVLHTYRTTYTNPSDNYFYHQFVYNEYPQDGDIPIYLQNKKPVEINFPVRYINDDIIRHIGYKADNSYDFVHLTNITDWLDPVNFCQFLDEIGRVLKPNGIALLRRLNSDINIGEYMENYYRKKGRYQFTIEEKLFDKSHFYSEVVAITKLK